MSQLHVRRRMASTRSRSQTRGRRRGHLRRRTCSGRPLRPRCRSGATGQGSRSGRSWDRSERRRGRGASPPRRRLHRPEASRASRRLLRPSRPSRSHPMHLGSASRWIPGRRRSRRRRRGRGARAGDARWRRRPRPRRPTPVQRVREMVGRRRAPTVRAREARTTAIPPRTRRPPTSSVRRGRDEESRIRDRLGADSLGACAEPATGRNR